MPSFKKRSYIHFKLEFVFLEIYYKKIIKDAHNNSASRDNYGTIVSNTMKYDKNIGQQSNCFKGM